MLLNGLTITVVGMVIVFAFLIILVASMYLLFGILKRFFPNALKPKPDEKPQVTELAPAPPPEPVEDKTPEIAAAVAAVRAYISTRG